MKKINEDAEDSLYYFLLESFKIKKFYNNAYDIGDNETSIEKFGKKYIADDEKCQIIFYEVEDTDNYDSDNINNDNTTTTTKNSGGGKMIFIILLLLVLILAFKMGSWFYSLFF